MGLECPVAVALVPGAAAVVFGKGGAGALSTKVDVYFCS